MKPRFLLVASALVACTLAHAQKHGFAIVIDKESYSQAKNEVDQYAKSIEADGLKTYIVVDRWYQPDSIKQELKRLYHQKTAPIEGAVFIGDIPIPMLRDAQHFTSAFKMDQRRDWQRSSVPSDRFYDDFGLTFDFIKQDTIKANYFYYSLRHDSKQTLNSDIYTARIRPLEKDATDKYTQLRNYLKKVVDVKTNEKNNIVDNLSVARGHGYNSQSKVAWAGEQIALKEQFSPLYNPGSFVKFMDYNTYYPMKTFWLNEILRPELDIMLFHHHGSYDAQYVSGYKEGSSPNISLDNIKLYLREKGRGLVKKGKTKEEAVDYYTKAFNVPRAWTEEAFDPKFIEQDSLFNESLYVMVSDIRKMAPNPRFVMFDACFNGSFYEDEYVAGAYIFGDGKTVVTQANTVNAIQDKWPDRYLGLLGLGLRVGQWNKHTQFLETHIIGDPTFRFASYNKSDKLDINVGLTTYANDISYWKKALSNDSPDVQAMALRMLHENNYKDISALLKDTYFSSSSMIVRLECLMLLSKQDDDAFVDVLSSAMLDSYELTRRFAVEFAAKNGSDKLIPSLATVILNDNTSERVAFKLSSSLRMIDLDKLEAELIRQSKEMNIYSTERLDTTLSSIRSNNKSRKEDNETVVNKSLPIKERRLELNRFRNHPASKEADVLLFVLSDKTDDKALRLIAAETLGWFGYSYNKMQIVDRLNELILAEQDAEIADEIKKTINRLATNK